MRHPSRNSFSLSPNDSVKQIKKEAPGSKKGRSVKSFPSEAIDREPMLTGSGCEGIRCNQLICDNACNSYIKVSYFYPHSEPVFFFIQLSLSNFKGETFSPLIVTASC